MKYLWAYSIPVVGVLGIYFGGYWSFSALLFAFVVGKAGVKAKKKYNNFSAEELVEVLK